MASSPDGLSPAQAYAKTLYEIRLLLLSAAAVDFGKFTVNEDPPRGFRATLRHSIKRRGRYPKNIVAQIDLLLADLFAERVECAFADPRPAWLNHRATEALEMRRELWVQFMNAPAKGKHSLSWVQLALKKHTWTEVPKDLVHAWDPSAYEQVERVKIVSRFERDHVLRQQARVSLDWEPENHYITDLKFLQLTSNPEVVREQLEKRIASYAHAVVWTNTAHELLIKDRICTEFGQLSWASVLGEKMQIAGVSVGRFSIEVSGLRDRVVELYEDPAALPARVGQLTDSKLNELFQAEKQLEVAMRLLHTAPELRYQVMRTTRRLIESRMDFGALSNGQHLSREQQDAVIARRNDLKTKWNSVNDNEAGPLAAEWYAVTLDYELLGRKRLFNGRNDHEQLNDEQPPPPEYSEALSESPASHQRRARQQESQVSSASTQAEGDESLPRYSQQLNLGTRSPSRDVIAAISTRTARRYNI